MKDTIGCLMLLAIWLVGIVINITVIAVTVYVIVRVLQAMEVL